MPAGETPGLCPVLRLKVESWRPCPYASQVFPEETLRPDAGCPHPQCRVIDDLLSKAYDAPAPMGRTGNSLSHLMPALSTSLQQATIKASATGLSDASPQAFALVSRVLGRQISTLVQTRRQVWRGRHPCQSHVEGSSVVEPGELLGLDATPAPQIDRLGTHNTFIIIFCDRCELLNPELLKLNPINN